MKLRLIGLRGSFAGREYELEQEWMLLGRGEDCALRFAGQDEIIVSGRHAMILARPDGFYLVDQQSTNGTYVNQVRVAQARLKSGDVIELGWPGPQLQAVIEETVPAPPYQAARIEAPPPPAFAPPPAAAAPPQVQWARGTADNLGLYNPDRDQGKAARSLGIGLALMIAAVIGLIIVGLTVVELGPVTALVSGIVAFIPAVFYLMILLWLDRYDPEPAWLLASAFAWGGLVAILISSIINSIFGVITSENLAAVISAPIIEEGTKGLGVLLIALAFRREFDSVVDGIVYAGVVALGFATVENVSYYGRSLNENGLAGLVGTFFVRGVLSPFAHVLFTGMTGIGCGIARETHKKALRVAMPIVGYVAAMMLHALWNGIASINGRIFLLMYFVVLVPLFHVFVGTAIYLARREGRILREMLAREVGRGLITEDQLKIASSVIGRWSWLTSAMGNNQLFSARRRFLRAVTKLGLCHWHVARAAAAQAGTQSFTLIPKLQAEVLGLRDQVG